MAEAPSPTKLREPAFIALAALLTVSGSCGLVFELIWVKLLSLALGQTTLAVSLVVAAFLGGLVLGSFFLGKLADRARRPLRAYAAMELSTGILAFGATWLMGRLPDVLGRLGLPGGGPLALRVCIAALVVLPPTFAMGGTIPAAVRFATRSLSSLGRSFGTLYSLNTLGAAAGCALTGFVLIGALGLSRTALLAASLNVAVAILALGLDAWAARGERWRFDRLSANGDGVSGAAGPALEEQALLPDRARRALVAAFALSGFASIAYEVLWFRVLASSLESSAYAFALLLSTFLLGLVLGGLLYTAVLANYSRQLELFASV